MPKASKQGGITYVNNAQQSAYAQYGDFLANLSLENGMTAGYGNNDGHYTNPNPTDGSAVAGTYGGLPKWPTTRVGVIRNVPGTIPMEGGPGYYAMYFLYNPTAIGVSFSTNTSQIPALYLYGGGVDQVGNTFSQYDPTQNVTDSTSLASTVPNLTQGQTVSWDLLFDRTYDMMYSENPNQNRGVLKDVAALYNIMGTFETAGAVPVSTPVEVAFGITASQILWGFTGFITNVNIQYGIFRSDMIPSRCSIHIDMTCSYVGAAVPSNSNSFSVADHTNNPNAPTVFIPNPNETNFGGQGTNPSFGSNPKNNKPKGLVPQPGIFNPPLGQ